ncbi:hypothetical protein CPB83DRAFT_841126 [Crepidotus variabilis]|uniref:Uncharacterized protein n=1 Tax=Crepidotus variabilis TaxID=179855 RepID=A0A9P6JHX5_9AGAR|nr:hypothetical protein CPB83DRAFT_841126 [Crepidotus variabilis]
MCSAIIQIRLWFPLRKERDLHIIYIFKIRGPYSNLQYYVDDFEEYFYLQQLRKDFRVGDTLSFKDGAGKKWGWILSMWTEGKYEDQEAVVMTYGTLEEYKVSLTVLQFHEESLSMAPQILNSRMPTHKQSFMCQNRNKWFIGKSVQVIGLQHYKGATGTIHDASPDGRCQVNLNIFGHSKPEPFYLKDVRIVPRTLPAAPTPPWHSTPMPEDPVSETNPAWNPAAGPDDTTLGPSTEDSMILSLNRRVLLRLEDGQPVVQDGMFGTMKAPLEDWTSCAPLVKSKCMCISGDHFGEKFTLVRTEGEEGLLWPAASKYNKREVLIRAPLTSLIDVVR